jgi:elongation factor Ts
MLERIVAGKLDRWYAELVLLEQPFVKDEKQSVGAYLRGLNPQLTINRAVRIEIGEVG